MSERPSAAAALRPTGAEPRLLATCPSCQTGPLVLVRVALHPANEGMAWQVNVISGDGFEFPTDTSHAGMPLVDLYLQCLDCEQWAVLHLASGVDGTRFLYGPMPNGPTQAR
jgi:hypothetical protein